MGNDRNEELGLERLTTRITHQAMANLQAECKRRYRDRAARVPYGLVVSELLLEHLPQARNGNASDSPKQVGPKRAVDAKRKFANSA